MGFGFRPRPAARRRSLGEQDMAKPWTADDILKMAGAFQPACVLTAAAELGVFDALADGGLPAEALAAKLGADTRATTMLADAMSALDLLVKSGDRYTPAAGAVNTMGSCSMPRELTPRSSTVS